MRLDGGLGQAPPRPHYSKLFYLLCLQNLIRLQSSCEKRFVLWEDLVFQNSNTVPCMGVFENSDLW